MRNKEIILLKNGRIITPRGEIYGDVLIEGENIKKIGHINIKKNDKIKEIDCKDCLILSGFVELHCYGAKGRSTLEGNMESLNEISLCLSSHGTTGFLMAINPVPYKKMLEFISLAKEAQKIPLDGAKLLGIHFEGPYINLKKAGGLPPNSIRPPDIKEVASLVKKGRDVFKMMTLSPELPGSLEIIELLQHNSIVASAGHTEATIQDIQRAIKQGLSHVTHIFDNLEGGLILKNDTRQEEGCLSEFLIRDELTAGVIADGVHVSPGQLKLLFRVKGCERVAVTTDCCMPVDLPKRYFEVKELDGAIRKFEIRNNAVWLSGTDQLVGSILTIDRAFINLQQMAGLTPCEASISCSYVPSKILDLKNIGEFKKGNKADITVMTDKGKILYTFVTGKCVYEYK